jgi:hypothetical protein
MAKRPERLIAVRKSTWFEFFSRVTGEKVGEAWWVGDREFNALGESSGQILSADQINAALLNQPRP